MIWKRIAAPPSVCPFFGYYVHAESPECGSPPRSPRQFTPGLPFVGTPVGKKTSPKGKGSPVFMDALSVADLAASFSRYVVERLPTVMDLDSKSLFSLNEHSLRFPPLANIGTTENMGQQPDCVSFYLSMAGFFEEEFEALRSKLFSFFCDFKAWLALPANLTHIPLFFHNVVEPDAANAVVDQFLKLLGIDKPMESSGKYTFSYLATLSKSDSVLSFVSAVDGSFNISDYLGNCSAESLDEDAVVAWLSSLSEPAINLFSCCLNTWKGDVGEVASQLSMSLLWMLDPEKAGTTVEDDPQQFMIKLEDLIEFLLNCRQGRPSSLGMYMSGTIELPKYVKGRICEKRFFDTRTPFSTDFSLSSRDIRLRVAGSIYQDLNTLFKDLLEPPLGRRLDVALLNQCIYGFDDHFRLLEPFQCAESSNSLESSEHYREFQKNLLDEMKSGTVFSFLFSAHSSTLPKKQIQRVLGVISNRVTMEPSLEGPASDIGIRIPRCQSAPLPTLMETNEEWPEGFLQPHDGATFKDWLSQHVMPALQPTSDNSIVRLPLSKILLVSPLLGQKLWQKLQEVMSRRDAAISLAGSLDETVLTTHPVGSEPHAFLRGLFSQHLPGTKGVPAFAESVTAVRRFLMDAFRDPIKLAFFLTPSGPNKVRLTNKSFCDIFHWLVTLRHFMAFDIESLSPAKRVDLIKDVFELVECIETRLEKGVSDMMFRGGFGWVRNLYNYASGTEPESKTSDDKLWKDLVFTFGNPFRDYSWFQSMKPNALLDTCLDVVFSKYLESSEEFKRLNDILNTLEFDQYVDENLGEYRGYLQEIKEAGFAWSEFSPNLSGSYSNEVEFVNASIRILETYFKGLTNQSFNKFSICLASNGSSDQSHWYSVVHAPNVSFRGRSIEALKAWAIVASATSTGTLGMLLGMFHSGELSREVINQCYQEIGILDDHTGDDDPRNRWLAEVKPSTPEGFVASSAASSQQVRDIVETWKGVLPWKTLLRIVAMGLINHSVAPFLPRTVEKKCKIVITERGPQYYETGLTGPTFDLEVGDLILAPDMDPGKRVEFEDTSIRGARVVVDGKGATFPAHFGVGSRGGCPARLDVERRTIPYELAVILRAFQPVCIPQTGDPGVMHFRGTRRGGPYVIEITIPPLQTKRKPPLLDEPVSLSGGGSRPRGNSDVGTNPEESLSLPGGLSKRRNSEGSRYLAALNIRDTRLLLNRDGALSREEFRQPKVSERGSGPSAFEPQRPYSGGD